MANQLALHITLMLHLVVLLKLLRLVKIRCPSINMMKHHERNGNLFECVYHCARTCMYTLQWTPVHKR